MIKNFNPPPKRKIVNWKTPIEINPVIEEMFYIMGTNIGGTEGFVMKNINCIKP